MKLQTRSGFTLIEMLTVMLIIAILAGMVLSLNRLVNDKGARSKAEGEIAAIAAACNNYKADNGTVPRDLANGTTDKIEARTSSTLSASNCQASSLFLYKELTGDTDLDGVPGDNGAKVYYECKSDMLGATRTNGQVPKTLGIVRYLQDPWGNSYAYSTANVKQEEDYKETLRTSSTAARPAPKGFNSEFDLWSTAGSTNYADGQYAKWVKNW